MTQIDGYNTRAEALAEAYRIINHFGYEVNHYNLRNLESMCGSLLWLVKALDNTPDDELPPVDSDEF